MSLELFYLFSARKVSRHCKFYLAFRLWIILQRPHQLFLLSQNSYSSPSPHYQKFLLSLDISFPIYLTISLFLLQHGCHTNLPNLRCLLQFSKQIDQNVSLRYTFRKGMSHTIAWFIFMLVYRRLLISWLAIISNGGLNFQGQSIRL